MAVVGVGVDAIEIERVERALARTPRLADRLFTEAERARCTSSCGRLKSAGLAARFAAKEAVAKAFGTGVHGFAWRDIEVHNNMNGQPEVRLHNGARARAEKMGVASIHLSLTTARDIAIANVVLEN